ncbi:MAG: CapA family protein [Clostridiaceae bacterium]|nr:CapA family protein [Clostridiaceae bacterium]
MKKYIMLGLFTVLILMPNHISGSYSFENIRKNETEKHGIISEQQPKQSEQNLRIAVGGDVLLDRSVGRLIDKHGNDSIWGDVKGILTSADISMVNLESPLSHRGCKEKDKQFIFRGKPQYVKALESAGIDIVSLANNHILDYGEIALSDTMKHLDDTGILYAGAGQNDDAAYTPVYIDKGTVRLAVLSASHVIPFAHWRAEKNKPGIASAYDPARLLSEVKTASEKADIVLVYLHWGKEMKTQPEQYQKNIARSLIDAGADLVVGSHPHIIQGLEFYKGRLIAYSLGNLVFTNSSRETMVLDVSFLGQEISEAYVIPCIIKSSKTMLVKDDQKKQEFLGKLNMLSPDVLIHEDGRLEQKGP